MSDELVGTIMGWTILFRRRREASRAFQWFKARVAPLSGSPHKKAPRGKATTKKKFGGRGCIAALKLQRSQGRCYYGAGGFYRAILRLLARGRCRLVPPSPPVFGSLVNKSRKDARHLNSGLVQKAAVPSVPVANHSNGRAEQKSVDYSGICYDARCRMKPRSDESGIRRCAERSRASPTTLE